MDEYDYYIGPPEKPKTTEDSIKVSVKDLLSGFAVCVLLFMVLC